MTHEQAREGMLAAASVWDRLAELADREGLQGFIRSHRGGFIIFDPAASQRALSRVAAVACDSVIRVLERFRMPWSATR